VSAPRKRRTPAVKPLLRGGRGLRWRGTAAEAYKQSTADGDWESITRQVLFAGSRGDAMRFDVRYFELAGTGRSSLERHRHAHVVIALYGTGRVRIGARWARLRRFDACYIGPNITHQLRSDGAAPFGFLCVVDAKRDRGRPVLPVRKRRMSAQKRERRP
jgi:quercetin dioxygenase-like cupin family protein